MTSQLSTFVGRSIELSEYESDLLRSRLVTLIGPGGVGKTRIALQLASRVAPEHADGVALVDLGSIGDPALLGQSVASAVGVQESLGRGLIPALLGALSRRSLLLVLDNCEHLILACAALVPTILETCAEVRVLATSREPIGIAGETVRQVPPMAVDEAAALFESRMLEATSANRAEPDVVRRLCQRLDCIPLAIELAAGRARALTVEQILARLDDPFPLLQSTSASAPGRHRTLEDTIAWSYQLLSREERSLWHQLSVFSGRFDLEAAERVARIEQRSTLPLLARLVDRSVLHVEHDGASAAYRLLESIRDFGRARLGSGESETEVLVRFTGCYLDRALKAESAWRGPHQAEWLARAEADLPNFEAAMQMSLASSAEVALRMASCLWFFWNLTGRLSEGRRWLERALAAHPDHDAIRARGLNDAGFLAYAQGDSEAALPLLEESLELGRELGDEQAIAYATTRLGIGALFHGDAARAAALLEEGLARYRLLKDVVGIYLSAYELAEALYRLGNLERSTELHEESLNLKRQRGDRWHIAFSLFGLGQLAWKRRDLKRAEQLLRESLEVRAALGDRIGIANSIEALAWVATSRGEYPRAGRLMGCATELLHRIGSRLAPHLQQSRAECEAILAKAFAGRRLKEAMEDGARLNPDEYMRLAMGAVVRERRLGGLTVRELAVARLVARGLANKEIAFQLSISERTAESHVEHIRNKLGLHTRSQVAAWAARSEIGTEAR